MEQRLSASTFHETARIVAERHVAGQKLIEAFYPPRLRISNHSHERANFCIAYQGTCTELYGAKRREYEPLTLAFLPANHVHSLTFGELPLRCFTVNIDPQLLISLRECSLSVDESLHCHGGHLTWLTMRLYNEFLQEDTASMIAIEGLLLEMLAAASRQRVAPEKKPPRWLQQVKEMLDNCFLDNLSLSVISRTAGVHAVHLSREFRRHYHCAVGEYIRRLRIQYACQEMLNPETSLAQIASAAGFADQSHFGRTFKSLVGLSPAAFRASLRRR